MEAGEDIQMTGQNVERAATSGGSSNKLPKMTERSKLEKIAGKILLLLTIVSFIFVGLLVNVLQLCLLVSCSLSSYPKWRALHKKLNGELLYVLFSQPIFTIYFWSRAKLNIVLKDLSIMKDVKKPILALVLGNHTYELDWMACFVIADQLGNLGAYKCFAKDELKYLPVIGWAFWMSDLIYVKRDWKLDRPNISKKLDELLAYDQTIVGIFAEGTRFTPEKLAYSNEFAKSRGIEPLKYHLLPRPRGFNYTMRHYWRYLASKRSPSASQMTNGNDDEKGPLRVFNMQIMLPERPRFRDYLEGRQLVADIYCEEVALDEKLQAEVLASSDEDQCPRLSKLLHDIYRRKDQLTEEYHRNGNRFLVDESSGGGHYPLRRPWRAYLWWMASFTFTYATFVYLALTVFADSLLFWSLLVIFLTSGLLLLKRIERESKPKTGTPLSSANNKQASDAASLTPSAIKTIVECRQARSSPA